MTIYTSPIGDLGLTADADGALTAVSLPGFTPPEGHPASPATIRQLDEYFASEREVFDLPLHPQGTPFELAVWDELRRIPYGQTISYGELAARVGRGSPRAVGRANARNPLAIVVPCHRVIGSDGSLTGYAGGLECKRELLTLEGALLL